MPYFSPEVEPKQSTRLFSIPGLPTDMEKNVLSLKKRLNLWKEETEEFLGRDMNNITW